MRTPSTVLIVIGCCFAGSVAAQNMKPGLWEVTNKMSGGGADMAQMQQQMANMPADQRRMMEEMMAKQGIKLGAGGVMSVKTCVTKEMAEREVPGHQGDCKYTSQQRSGNTTKVAFTCSNPPSKGETQVTYHSSESYSMKATVTTTVAGKPETHVTESSGKWLGSDCGSVKPPVLPKGMK